MELKKFICAYVYVRDHRSFEKNYKVGVTVNLLMRDRVFRTNEYVAGHFIQAFLVNKTDLLIIDSVLKKELKNFWCSEAAGTEFYNNEIINSNIIEKTLTQRKFFFKQLDINQIKMILAGQSPIVTLNQSVNIMRIEHILKDETIFYLYLRRASSDTSRICWGLTVNLNTLRNRFPIKHTKCDTFQSVFEIISSKKSETKKLFKAELSKYFLLKEPISSSSTIVKDFYNSEIINLIEQILEKKNYSYKKLTLEEIRKQISDERTKKK